MNLSFYRGTLKSWGTEPLAVFIPHVLLDTIATTVAWILKDHSVAIYALLQALLLQALV